MAILTREQCLGADDLPRRVVAVPEWGGEVVLRTLNVAERLALAPRGGEDSGRFGLKLLAAAARDEEGQALFRPEDIEALSGKSHAAVERLIAAALKLNGADTASVEALEKN